MLIVAAGGCDWGAEKSAGRPDSTGSDQAPRSAGDTAGRIYVFHGTPRAIDTVRGIITIDHEKIGDLMEAMTMPFPVADRALLEQVAIGRTTHFTLRVDGSTMTITKVQDSHDPGHQH
jgi:Cu/Ag efflux protein CusF